MRFFLCRNNKKLIPASARTPTGTPTPAPIAAAWFEDPEDTKLEVVAEVAVVVAAVEVALLEAVEVVPLFTELVDCDPTVDPRLNMLY